MKKIFTVVLMITSGLVAQAQTPSKEDADIANGVEKLRAAMVSGNRADLESLLSKDLSYSHSDGHVQTRAEFINGIVSKESDFVKIDLRQQSINVIDNIAIVRHILEADTNDGGKPAHIVLGIVLVWRNEGGHWKVIARRAFSAPKLAPLH